MSFQRVTLIGYVTKTGVESRTVGEGNTVANFNISTVNTLSKTTPSGAARPCPEGWTESKNGKQWEVRTYWRITAWGRTAEFVSKYINPGDNVFVDGEMKGQAVAGVASPRIWEDKGGAQHADYEVTASVVKAVGGQATKPATTEEEDEIPF
jgi:single-stranded DNA-binding protein